MYIEGGATMKSLTVAMLALGKAYEKDRSEYESNLEDMKRFLEVREPLPSPSR